MTFIYLIVVALISGFIGYVWGNTTGETTGFNKAKAMFKPAEAPVKVAVSTPATKATPKVAVAAKKTARVAKTAKKGRKTSKR